VCSSDLSPPPAAAPAPQPAAPKAQPDEIQLKLDGWKSEIEQIAAGVQRDGQSDRRLADLRERADAIREAVDEIDRAESPRVAAVEARLKQLGPAPTAKEGEPEPVEADAVKTEREDQQKLLAEAQGRVKQAQLLHLRADEIAKAIADKRRTRFADDMVERSRSVMEPSVWLEALRSMPAILSGLVYLLRDWFSLLAGRGLETATAVGSVITVLLVILWGARRRLALITERNPDAADPTMLVRALKAAGIVLVNFAAPVLSLLGVARALDVFELNPARVDLFITALVEGVAAAAMVYGIALAILAPGKPQWRMAPVGDQTAVRLLRLFVSLAIVHGFGIWFLRVLDVLAAPVATLILASGLFAVIDAALVMLALRTAARSMAGDEETAEIAEAATERRSSLWRWFLPLGWILAIGAAVAAFGGYVALASFVTQQMVRTGFLLGALYILLVLADEAIQATFQARSAFGQVMTRSMGLARETVEQIGVVLSGLVRLLLIAAAGLFILAPIGIDGQDVVTDAKTAFFGFRVGGLTFSLSAILTGLAFLGLGIAVTRGVQGWLDQRFLPRTRLDVGLKNSIRTSFGYVGTIVSVALAFSVVGLDLQNLAIVAGALSVGVGFGLQSIVNNFVSGLILLAERPIKSGDLVEIGAEKGFVRKINVRSTEIETFDRASLIVPNSSLISGNVKNWMHRDLTGRCVVNVGVSYETDPEQVRGILLGCAGAHEKVLKFPVPVVFFTNFGADALEFRLICTVGAVTDAFGVESDLRFAIVAGLRDAGIEIPYAQRDINIRQLGDIGDLLDRFGFPARPPESTGEVPKP
jgi:small-conductance mechanosensitive channel